MEESQENLLFQFIKYNAVKRKPSVMKFKLGL
jgi:hypothetical protein